MRWPSTSTKTDCLTDETMYVLTPDTVQTGGQQSVEALKAWSLLQAEKFRETIAKRRCLAEARQSQAEKDRQDHAAQLAALRVEQRALPRPSWARAVLLLMCAFVGLTAEFALTYVTIPFVLDLKRSSLLAILLSLSPVAATLVLDGIFDRLFEQPWLAARSAASSGHDLQNGQEAERRMTWFLIMLGLLVVGMFLALGLARMEAVHWQNMLMTPDATTELTPLVSLDLALIVFSIGVLVGTAWLLLLGLRHARLCARHAAVSIRMSSQTHHFRKARQEAAEAAAEAARWRSKDAQSHRLTLLVAQWLFACQMIQLNGGQSAQTDLAQRVERALSHLELSDDPAALTHRIPDLLSTQKEVHP
ncbi:MAG: hypothetical protein MRJ68_11725 [Nitrospira sp.]|nr:hypothetical protein [Nitrospira sp.]